MYKIMFSTEYGNDLDSICFEGGLEECVRMFNKIENDCVADPYEERCYIADENGEEMDWFDIEEIGYNID